MNARHQDVIDTLGGFYCHNGYHWSAAQQLGAGNPVAHHVTAVCEVRKQS